MFALRVTLTVANEAEQRVMTDHRSYEQREKTTVPGGCHRLENLVTCERR